MPSRLIISHEQYDAMNAAWWKDRVLSAVREMLPVYVKRTSIADLRTKIDTALQEASNLDVASEQAQIRYVCLSLLFGAAFFEAPEFAGELKKHDGKADDAVESVFKSLEAELNKQQR